MTVCKIDGCGNQERTKGLCNRHYLQIRTFGEPRKRTTRTPNNFITEDEITRIECYDKNSNVTGYTLIDTEDIEKCKQYKWVISNGKAKSTNKLGLGPGKMIQLHTLILGAEKGKHVDHKNLNGLDNRKENLRFADKSQNGTNTFVRKDNKTGYKGVSIYAEYYDRVIYCASIQINGRKKHLGVFPTKELAALAYNNMALKVFGEFARVNVIE